MKRTWIEHYAGNDFKMKVIRFGKWAVEFGMDVRRFNKGWNFKKIVKNWSDLYYRGHIGRMWYDGIEVTAAAVCDVTLFLYKAYTNWEKANNK